MNYESVAPDILTGVGGASNIAHFEHCSTRLRFTLHDDTKVDADRLKGTPGVMGVVRGPQTQVVIGNDVIEVYDALTKQPGMGAERPASEAAASKTRRKFGAILLDFIVGVFQPLIPAIAGAGVLKSLLLLLALLGWIDKAGPTYTVLVSISDAVFYFLPLMVAVTTATKLGTNKLVALSAVSVLLLPSMTTLMASEGGASVFGLPITNVPYATQVFPAILAVLLLSVLEGFWTRFSPKPIRIFFVPMMSLLITVPVTLLVLGPLGYRAGQLFTFAILWLHGTVGWLAVVALALALPFIIAVGMHKALLPYAIASITTTGRELLYLPASLAHNIAQSGACFGVAIRTKNKILRPTAISAGVSALFGITEPALYGVTLQNKRALYSVMAGAGIGAAYLGITVVAGFTAVGPGLASITMFVDELNPMNIVHACIGAVISFVVALGASLFLWRDAATSSTEEAGITQLDPSESLTPAHAVTREDRPDKADTTLERLQAPVTGEIIPLESVQDPVFAGKVLGEGCAILPQEDQFRAPFDGTIATVFKSHHAVAMRTPAGAEVLIHVGIDTVRLEGKFFTPHVVAGQQVTAGEVLLTADLTGIQEAGYDTTTPVVILNPKKFDVNLSAAGPIEVGNEMLTVINKEQAHANSLS